jgi:hypothetical protein
MPRCLGPLLAVFALGGCEAVQDPEPARQAVADHFAERYPGGRVGLLLKGHNVWLEAPYFNKECLESKNLAFNDDPSTRPAGTPARISPTFAAQRWLSASTDQGYCVYMGIDPKLTIDDASWGGDRWRVSGTVSVTEPSPWFECLEMSVKKRIVEVSSSGDGAPQLEGEIDLYTGDCPVPLPDGWERPTSSRPRKAPSKPPSVAQVKKLVGDFDAALASGDHSAARSMTSCVNLFADGPWGACALGDFVAVGPSFPDEQRAAHGTPWLEYSLKKIDDIGKIVKDKDDPTLYHVTLRHKRTGKPRSFSVQWAGGGWKMLGVISQQAEAITAVRYLNDLHDREKRDIFARRLKGEKIDHLGHALEPEAEEG